jgi:Transcriptional regulator containing PAS, AAA-type ATPase, and DNA-binding domains
MYESISFFEGILDNIDIPVAVANKAAEYVYANTSFVRISDLTIKEIIGKSVRYYYENKIADSFLFELVLADRKQVTQIQKIKYENAVLMEKILTASPVFGEQGDVEFVVYTYQDREQLELLYRQAHKTVSIQQGVQKNGESLVYKSALMTHLVEEAALIAKTDSSVLISGESGAGKEVIADFIHANSRRADKEMVVINCAGIPETLLDAELFGYEKGAFTGALTTGKPGLMETADGSTLFLDEINSLPRELQGKLLRAIETKKVKRIGSVREKSIDFRILAASNTDLNLEMQAGNFRSDLYYRLNVMPLHLPPLRERKDDILPLCDHFLKQLGEKYDRMRVLSPDVQYALLNHDWPGNVRELKNVLERLVITSSLAREITAIPFSLSARSGSYDKPSGETAPAAKPVPSDEASAYRSLPEGAKSLIRALRDNGYNISNAAAALGVSRRTLHYKLKRYNITLESQICVDGTVIPLEQA